MTSVLDVPGLQGPPDIGAALQMLSEGLQERRARREDETKRLLAQNIGGSLAGGDFQGAADTAFATGDLSTGLKIHELSLQQKKQFAETVQRHVMVATPETWPGLRQKLTDLTGEDPGEDFETAKADILSDYGDLDTILSANERASDNERADAQLDISQQHLQLAQENAQGGAKPPAGFIRTPEGETTFDPGGPHDPAVIEREAKARGAGAPARSRTLTTTAITDIGEKGAAYDNFSRLSGTWNDDFGGYGVEALGDYANFSGRNNPFADEAQVVRADWWQDYQTQKNIVRNKLFGSALTATEKGEFEKANINPGMRPDIIKKNLARQTAAVTKAAKKLANVYIQQGYSPDVIEAALGVSLVDLGLEGLRTGDVTAEPAASEEVDENEVPQAFIDAGMEPEDWRFVEDKDVWR